MAKPGRKSFGWDEQKQKIKESARGTGGTTRSQIGWSDKVVMETAQKYPLIKVQNEDQRLGHALAFMKFYLTGKKLLADTGLYLICRAASSLCYLDVNGSVVDMWEYTSDRPTWMYIPPTTETVEDFLKGLAESSAPNYDQYMETERDRLLKAQTGTEAEKLKKVEEIMSQSKDSQFETEYKTLLDEYLKCQDERTKNRQLETLVNTAGFTAAVCLRMIGKDVKNVRAAFLKQSFQKNLKLYGKWTGSHPLRIPSKAFLDSLEGSVVKGEVATKAVLSHFLSAKLKEDHPADSFGNAAFLTHLQFNGLLPLHYITLLNKRTRVPLSDTMKDLWTSQNYGYLTHAIEFLNKYNDTNDTANYSKLWAWCRAFDDGYFSNLGTDAGVTVIATVGGALSTISPDYLGIDQGNWVQNINNELKEKCWTYGEELARLRYIDLEVIEENQDILEAVNRKKIERQTFTAEENHTAEIPDDRNPGSTPHEERQIPPEDVDLTDLIR